MENPPGRTGDSAENEDDHVMYSTSAVPRSPPPLVNGDAYRSSGKLCAYLQKSLFKMAGTLLKGTAYLTGAASGKFSPFQTSFSVQVC
jgi:hypothetical protein